MNGQVGNARKILKNQKQAKRFGNIKSIKEKNTLQNYSSYKNKNTLT